MAAASILVVDDDADIRLLVAEVLRLAGYDVATAASGVDAIERLATTAAPDLVLLDVQMPEMDGWDTLRWIRGEEHLRAVPVILCTVKAGAADTSLGWSIGCDGYLPKPFAIDALVGAVRGALATPADIRLAKRCHYARSANSLGA